MSSRVSSKAGPACHDSGPSAGRSLGLPAGATMPSNASRRPWRRADRSGRRSTAPSASQALGPTRLAFPAQTGPSGDRRHGCRHDSRRPSNGRPAAAAACWQLSASSLPGGANEVSTNLRGSNRTRRDTPAPTATRGSVATASDQRHARGCPCWRADRWRAAVNLADNRAVGNHSALFELQAPGELAQVLVGLTARLTGGPTGPTGEMDSLPRRALGAGQQRSLRGARWRP